MKKLVIAAALVLAACGGPAPSGDGVEISDLYIAEPLKGRNMTAGYFSATNTGPDTRITAASSPIAERIELHTHPMNDGVMQMRQVDGVDVAAGETVTFEPGGLHLMLFGVDVPDGTTEAPVTLEYADGESVTVVAEIRSR